MDVVIKFLIQNGMSGVFIIAMIYALKQIYKQFTAQVNDIKKTLDLKETENKQIENEFRTHLIENEKTLFNVVSENTKVFKEFSFYAKRSNEVLSEVLEELKRREFYHECKGK